MEERTDGGSSIEMPSPPRSARRVRADDALARLQFALDAAGVGTWQWELRTGQVTWSDNLEAIHGLPPGSFGGDFASFLEDVDPRDRESVMARIQAAMASGGDYHVEYRLATAAGERWVEGKGRVVLDRAGKPLRMSGVCMDITARKQAELRLELLMGELRHRVKNLLAVIRSLSARTLSHAASLEAFGAAFEGRLSGLAGAHDLLVESHWQGAGLRALIRAQLSPWLVQSDRLRLAGDDLTLPTEAALTLGMALHELATNAAKYGALSVEAGEVDVAWRRAPAADGHELVLLWQERGGPRVRPPAHRSFGSELIERGVAYGLGGAARLEFPAEGVRCELRLPLAAGRGDGAGPSAERPGHRDGAAG